MEREKYARYLRQQAESLKDAADRIASGQDAVDIDWEIDWTLNRQKDYFEGRQTV